MWVGDPMNGSANSLDTSLRSEARQAGLGLFGFQPGWVADR
jgi:hypothetical protein